MREADLTALGECLRRGGALLPAGAAGLRGEGPAVPRASSGLGILLKNDYAHLITDSTTLAWGIWA